MRILKYLFNLKLKPENIMQCSPKGNHIKIIDFGSAISDLIEDSKIVKYI